MSPSSSCPDVALLERLRAGAVTEPERKNLEWHLGLCDACNGKLEALAYDEEGSPRPIACPDRSVLKGLAEGTLGMYSCEAVEHHAEICAACQADVQAFSYGLEPAPRPRTAPCPDRSTLRRLLDGRLEGPEHAEIEGHLEACPSCQKALEEIACGDEPLVRQVPLRAPGRDGPRESPGLKRVIGLLKDEAGPEVATGGFSPAAPAEVLGLLDPSDEPGELGRLGPYRVSEVLGQGGMGVVFKAFDSALHRAVAIKVLAPQLATNNAARQRFAREARAAAAVRNEHVVAIHAVDEWKGLPYLVMEFIPGTSLQDRIDRTAPLDITSILRIGMQTAAGLAAAHAQGLVHRDIKPSNILLENGVERVKLTDFGLARAVDDASLTQSGVVAGTPLFMAPEQARCETIDHRADLFSLGAVLYAMCTGRSPFRASTTLGVLRRVSDDPHRPVREVNPDIPHWLAAIIDRLLAKDRAIRYQSAAEVSEVLGRHLARRQRSVSDESEPHPATAPHGLAARDDVGPAKGPARRRRLLERLGYLLVLLAVLLVVTEVTGVTRVVKTLPHILGRRPNSHLVVHIADPRRFRVTIDGHVPIPRTGGSRNVPIPTAGRSDFVFEPWISGCSVNVFEGDRRIDGMHLGLKPGLWIEVNVHQDGRLIIEYEGEVRSPNAPTQAVAKPSVRDATRLGPDTGAMDGTEPNLPPLVAELPDVGGMLAYAQQGQYLVAAGNSDTIAVYDTKAKTLQTRRIEGGDLTCLSTDGNRIVATRGSEGRARLWEVSQLALSDSSPRPMTILGIRSGEITAVALSREGGFVATGYADTRVDLWDRKGQLLNIFGGRPRGQLIDCLQFDPAGRTLALGVGGVAGGVEIWDLKAGAPPRAARRDGIGGAPVNVRCLALTVNGKELTTLAAGGDDHKITLWDLHLGKIIESLNMPTAVSALDFSPDGELLAIGLMDGQVVIWNTPYNFQEARFRAHSSPVKSLAFAPDGRTLATGGLVGTGDGVRIWATGELVEEAARTPRRFQADPRPLGPDGRPIGSRVRVPRAPEENAKEAAPKSPASDMKPAAKGGAKDLSGPLQSRVDQAHHRLQDALLAVKRAREMKEKSEKDVETRKAGLRRVEQLYAAASVPADEVDKARIRVIEAERDRDVWIAQLALYEALARKARWDDAEAAARLEHAQGKSETPPSEKQKEMPLRRAEADRDVAAAKLAWGEAKLKATKAIGEIERQGLARVKKLYDFASVPYRAVSDATERVARVESEEFAAEREVADVRAQLEAAQDAVRTSER